MNWARNSLTRNQFFQEALHVQGIPFPGQNINISIEISKELKLESTHSANSATKDGFLMLELGLQPATLKLRYMVSVQAWIKGRTENPVEI